MKKAASIILLIIAIFLAPYVIAESGAEYEGWWHYSDIRGTQYVNTSLCLAQDKTAVMVMLYYENGTFTKDSVIKYGYWSLLGEGSIGITAVIDGFPMEFYKINNSTIQYSILGNKLTLTR